MTRLQTLMLAGSISLTGVMIGCDDQLAQTAKARAALDEAIAVLDEAEQGFLSDDSAGSYTEFRTQRLSDAESKLKAVIALDTDRLSKTGAHRLLSGVKSSQGRTSAEQAAAGFTQINQTSVGLFNQIATAQRINALIVARGGDSEAIIAALEEGQGMISQSKAAANAGISELSVLREGAANKAESLNSQAASHLTRAQEFEEQSLVAPNDEVKQDVYTKAYSAQLDAQEAQRKAQEQEIEAQLAAEQIAALQREIGLWDQMSEEIADLKQKVETEGTLAARDVAAAGSKQTIAFNDLEAEISKLVAAYNDGVQAPMEAATADMNLAVSELETAIGLADAADKVTLRFGQVGAKTELAGVLSRHANYAADFGAMLAAVLENPVISQSPAASSLRSQADGFAQQAGALTDQARDVISDGLAQSETMIGEDPIGQATQSLAQALRTYGDQLN
ncbi:MAG: hypothetical protein AAF911_04315 [Planctomycetota bacterium]